MNETQWVVLIVFIAATVGFLWVMSNKWKR